MPDVTFGPHDGRRLLCREGDARTEYTEKASGLRLRVTRAGARSWSVAYWSPAAKTARRVKLGDASRMPLAKARAAARAALYAVEEEGRDPAADRAAARLQEREERRRRSEQRQAAAEARRNRMTFGALCRAYVEHRRTTTSGRFNRPARRNTLLNWRLMLEHHVYPKLEKRPVETVTSEDFLEVLEAAVQHGGPSMGPRVRELLAAVWRWAEGRPRTLRVTLPIVSPLAGLPKVGVAEKERERALSPAEVWQFWRATEGEGCDGQALRLMLLTAARVREATDVERAELDLGTAEWRLPAARSKGGRERLIPLSPLALTLLREALERWPEDRPLASTSLPMTMRRVRAAMGGEPWQPRDLRRTAATLCARLGADPFVVALVLGHAHPDARMPAVTGGYLRWDYPDKVREALGRLGAWVEDTVTRESEPGDVVSIEARR
jgi:integrase